MRKKIGNITVAVAAFMAISGLGISSGAGRIDAIAAKQEVKAQKANTGGENTESKAADRTATESEAQINIAADKRLPKGFGVEGLGDNVATLDALGNALNSLQEKLDAKKFILDVKGEKIESSFAKLGAGISNKDFILAEAEKFTSGNMLERFEKSSELLEKPENITPDIVFNDDAVKAFL